MKIRWFKRRKRTVPANAICRNCGTQIIDRYCHVCGQDIFAGQEQSIFLLIVNLLDNAFAFEGKTLRTLGCLIFKPGFLSSEYRLGRIIRYVHPVKLFWMLTIIFFALFMFNIEKNIKTNRAVREQAEQTMPVQVTITEERDTATPAAVKSEDTKANKANKVNDFFNSEQTKTYLKSFAPYAAFLFIPVFAVLLWLFFWRKKYFYMYHLVFAVHFHSFLWILWSLLLTTDLLFPKWKFPSWLSLFFFLLPGIYLMIALNRFYQPKRKWSVVWKTMFITLLYLLTIILFLVVIFNILWLYLI